MQRVLMIEDNLLHQNVARRFLAHDFDFVFVGSFCEAVEQLSACNFDVALLDLNLPDSHGMDTLKQLVSKFPTIPVVVWSGAGDAAEAIRNGADEFFIKDGSIEGIKNALISAMARHKFAAVRSDISALQNMLKSDKT
jgi:DNA-binding NarL/FixJ family response regulator